MIIQSKEDFEIGNFMMNKIKIEREIKDMIEEAFNNELIDGANTELIKIQIHNYLEQFSLPPYEIICEMNDDGTLKIDIDMMSI